MKAIDFLGDVYLDKPYKIDISLNDYIFNLEFPLSTSGIPAKNKINLGVDKSYIYETFGKLPLAVNLANNHIMDYGEESFKKTLEFLDQNNIKYFGAGTKVNNFNNPAILELGDKKIACLGYSCISTNAVFGNEFSSGSALLEEERVIEDIIACKDKYDFVVLNLHWGDEEIKYPKPTDIKKARKFIENGADLIIGHHAHVVQSCEVYKGKSIYYGIGNFIFPDFTVPSHFDGENFTRFSSKIQAQHNKETIIVRLKEDMSVTYETASLFNDIVQSKKITVPNWRPKTEKQYNLYRSIWAKSTMLKAFLRRPRFPSIKQLKLFFGNSQ